MAQPHHSDNGIASPKSPVLEALYLDLDAFIDELSSAGSSATRRAKTPQAWSDPQSPVIRASHCGEIATDQQQKSKPSPQYNPDRNSDGPPFDKDNSCKPDSQASEYQSTQVTTTCPMQDSKPDGNLPEADSRRVHSHTHLAQMAECPSLSFPSVTSVSHSSDAVQCDRAQIALSSSTLAHAVPIQGNQCQPTSSVSSLDTAVEETAVKEATVQDHASTDEEEIYSVNVSTSNMAFLSVLGKKLVKEVQLLNENRKIFCSEEYPASFTGEEAVAIIQDGFPGEASPTVCLHIARALMRTSPPLIGAISYSEKSLKRNTVYGSTTEVYTLIEDTLNLGFPQGVFTPLTQCYTPLCHASQGGCYAPKCPNRLAKADTQATRQPSLLSASSSHDTTFSRTWSALIPREVLIATPPNEVKRQEAIHELIYTEEDYLRDLQLLHELYALPLRTAQCIEADRRDAFCDYVFNNYMDLLDIHKELCRELRDHQSECQAKGGFVDQVGHIFLRHLSKFMDVYTAYGPHVVLSEYSVKKESLNNMLFHNFIHEKEKMAECRKLPFRHFLILPVTRLQRYPLLMGAILNKTPDDHPDKALISECVDMLRAVASEMDKRAEKTKETLNIYEIDDALRYKPNEPVPDLKLKEPGRKLVYQGVLVRRQHAGVEATDLHVFLFDHLLIFTKKRKDASGRVEYHISRRVVPLELLYMQEATEGYVLNLKSSTTTTSSNLVTNTQVGSAAFASGFPILIQHLGKHGTDHLVYAESSVSRMTWKARIVEAKALFAKRSKDSQVFDIRSLSDTTFPGSTSQGQGVSHGKVTCSVPFVNEKGARMVAISTNSGVWIGSNGVTTSLRNILTMSDITQIAVLENEGILVVLADKTLHGFPLHQLDQSAKSGGGGKKTTQSQKISQNISFFHTGVCNGRTLLIAMKKRGVDSHFRVYEPVCGDLRDPKQAKFLTTKSGLFSKQPPSWFKLYTEFYIGALSFGIHLLRARVVVVCSRGFEIIDLDNLHLNRNLPDVSHPDFAQLQSRNDDIRPLGMFRCQEHFLLCYTTFAFRITAHGALVPGSWFEWEGVPQSTAFIYPYVVAFDPRFIEVRHAETGNLIQILAGEQMRLVQFHQDQQTPIIHGCMAHPFKPDYQYVFELTRSF